LADLALRPTAIVCSLITNTEGRIIAILTTTGISIDFSELTEDEHTRLMSLCFDVAMRQSIKAGEIEVKGHMIHSLCNRRKPQ
jgi:hypothetical protein